ncbi:PTS mannose transporter subunit IID [Massilimicrobiota sp. An142]|uniref:PTS system mannose/fructose/sorbose family transporter subunit IID n=1 Tax=unclassified Massilimicrobiota TaxID=2619866 RepID=UPI000B392438|nr:MULTISPECIES: PTS system mannose/fructose/sorbose family transporter subunit IID [unclassified Massilimicrobiota]OUQ12083.1 PTS mannose transporter subunit IID [Massilimicrobiota sp. An142]OUQ75225.1 PTS mannose transporter subunit IID [Massilimicrobiota sp. An105]
MTKTSNNENTVITKKDLRKMFWRSLPMEFSWHYERQMHMGFCTMISDGLRKIYKNNPEGLKKALQRHLEFFNITPHVSTFVGSITLAMEEMNANQDDFDESSINAVKAALMGPLSGIGDSLLLGTLRVLAVGIGTSLALQGNILGPILFLLIFNVPAFILRYVCAMKGYELGATYLEKIQKSGLMQKFMLAAAILGVMVIGGMTNELVSVTTPLAIGSGDTATQIQSILDGIMPGMLGLAVTGIYYKLLGKNVNVMWIIIGTAILGIVCAQFGILG